MFNQPDRTALASGLLASAIYLRKNISYRKTVVLRKIDELDLSLQRLPCVSGGLGPTK